MKIKLLLTSGIFLFLLTVIPMLSFAGYGDIVIDVIEDQDTADVVFPHWIHRMKFRCKVCHEEIFSLKAGDNHTSMEKIDDGKSCGTCHNGEIAWGSDECERCHLEEE